MKILKRIFLFFTALLFSLSLFACKEEPTVCTEHTDDDGDGYCDECNEEIEPQESETLVLIEDGEALFRIVLQDKLSSTVAIAVDELIEALEDAGIEAETVTDGKGSEQDCEVLIGTVNSRGDKYKYDGHTLGYEGYAVTRIDDKVIIAGGSDESLVLAIEKFKDDFLALDDEPTDVEISEEDWIEKPQDDYRIDEISVGGKELDGFVIVRESGDSLLNAISSSLQSTIYKKAGYWLDIKSEDGGANKITVRYNDDSGDDGFRIFTDGNDLIIECAHKNVFEDSVRNFLNTEIRTGKIEFSEDYLYTLPVSVVYYEDYGAIGNDSKDDFEGMKKAHEFANEGGQTVKSRDGGKFLIGDSGSSTITIKTNTVWTGMTIVIDDSKILPNSAASKTNVFTVQSDYKYTCYNETLENIDKMPFSSLESGAENIGWAPGFPAAIRVMSTYHKNHIRYGYGSLGSNQQEIILVDAEGNVDKSTPVMWDYDIVNYIEVYHADEEPITIKGGHIITKVYNPKSSDDWSYYARGIYVKRANTTVDGLTHTLEGEDEENGAVPYGSFLGAQFTTNITFVNCKFQGHRRAAEGSYDTGAFLVNNLVWRNCTQSNYAYNEATGKFIEAAVDENGKILGIPVTNDDGVWGRGLWGVMGTNVCKNLVYENCVLSRFDAHESTYNATIKDSQVTMINVTGAGELTIENCIFTKSPDTKSTNIITVRDDYGSMWRGTIKIKNLHVSNNPTSMQLFGTIWRNHYYGYECAMPNIEIDGISFDRKCTVDVFTASLGKRALECGDFSKHTINCSQTDTNGDGRCDSCYTSLCEKHAKADDKGRCSKCKLLLCTDGCKDENGNGRCDKCAQVIEGKKATGYENLNPYKPPEKIVIKNEDGNVSFRLVDIEFFEDTIIEGNVKRFEYK